MIWVRIFSNLGSDDLLIILILFHQWTVCTRSAILATTIMGVTFQRSECWRFYFVLALLNRSCAYREAEEFVKPHPSTVSIVDEWLTAHSIDVSSISRTAALDWVTLSIPVSIAESMLGCEFHVYQHDATGKQAIRTLEYSLPRSLIGRVDTIQPTTYFGFG